MLRVSPWQCLTSPLIVGLPFPAHPTVRAVCPSPAVCQSASHTMRRVRPVRAQATAAVGEPHRLPLAVRQALPSEPPACTSWGQVPAQAEIDEALQPAEGLAGVRVPDVVAPPVTIGCTIATHSCGLIGARRDVTYFSRFRMVCWADLAVLSQFLFEAF